MKYDEEVNCYGMVCPMPALTAKKALRKMKVGQILKVLIDYQPATESVPRDLAKTKHKFLGMEESEDDDGWDLYFECVK